MAGPTLGTAYVQIVPTTKGISGAMSQVLGGEAEAAGTSAGGKFASFAKKAIAGAAIGAAAVKGLKAAFDEGAALQQSYFGGLDTLYGEAADQARAYAREASAMGISMNDYSEQAVSFGAALKSAYGGDVKKAAEAANTAISDMADNSAKMGTDIGSIQNAYQGFAKQNYTMLDNLKLGYGGTKQEMQRLLEDAEALSGVEYDINNLGDVYDAIHVIQGDLGLTGVAAEEASETFSGSFGAMKAAAANFAGSLALGEGVDESLNTLTSSISTFVFKNLFPMLGTILKGLPSVIITLLKNGVPTLLSGLSSLFSTIATSVATFANGVTSEKVAMWAKTMLPKLASTAGSFVLKFASGLLKNMGKIVAAIAKIGAAIIKGLGSALWGKVTAAANGIRTRFLAPINALRDKVRGIIDKIKSFFRFNISAPHIPLPHFGITPKGWKLSDLLKGSIPSLSIHWNAEGAIFKKPTVLQGVGEAGAEAVVPLDPFWRKMDEIAENSQTNVTINVYPSEGMDEEKLADRVVNKIVKKTNRRRLAWV